jgi:hypothetical protein
VGTGREESIERKECLVGLMDLGTELGLESIELVLGCIELGLESIELVLGCIELGLGCIELGLGCIELVLGCIELVLESIELVLGCIEVIQESIEQVESIVKAEYWGAVQECIDLEGKVGWKESIYWEGSSD